MTKIPKINLKELDKQKEKNFKDRLKFIDLYVEYLKKNNVFKK
jgi:hypothetical protein